MVEAVGWKAAGVVAKAAPVAASAPAAAVVASPADDAPATGGTIPAAGGATGIARTMAAAPPVDTERVARIKAAIAAGKFPILPSTIADRLLAFKLDWNSNEARP